MYRRNNKPKLPIQPEKKYEEFDDDDDYEDDIDFSTTDQEPAMHSSRTKVDEEFLEKKHIEDKQRLLDFFYLFSDKAVVKKMRFLFISMQTYGVVDGLCIPAELALNEFDLEHGITERFHTIVAPPTPLTEIQQYRAQYHANESHAIPFDLPRKNYKIMDAYEVFEEVLGRSEPTIAVKQGLCVGLYEDASVKFSPDQVFAGSPDGRRWLICLRHEYSDIVNSLEYLKASKSLNYEGFPVTSDRYIFAHTLVEALAEFADFQPKEE
jgi:hypothetical protein